MRTVNSQSTDCVLTNRLQKRKFAIPAVDTPDSWHPSQDYACRVVNDVKLKDFV